MPRPVRTLNFPRLFQSRLEREVLWMVITKLRCLAVPVGSFGKNVEIVIVVKMYGPIKIQTQNLFYFSRNHSLVNWEIDFSIFVDRRKNGKAWLLSKNPQFLSDHYEILTKEGTHEDLILTKFRNDLVKIVDFLVKAYFWPSPETPGTQGGFPIEIETQISKLITYR